MDGESMAGHDQTKFLSRGHGVRCVCPRILQHRAAGTGGSYKTSESDGVGSRSRDGSIMGGALLNALGFQIGGDAVQDGQQLVARSGAVEQGKGKVAGHGRMLVWFERGGRWSEVCHHFVDLQSVNGRIIPAATVGGLFAATVTEHGNQVLIGTTEACQAACLIVQTLIVLNPEGHVPGLPVCPSVESGVGGGHVGSFELKSV